MCHTINPRLFPEQILWIANDAQDRMLCFDLSFLPLVGKLAPALPKIKHYIAMRDRGGPEVHHLQAHGDRRPGLPAGHDPHAEDDFGVSVIHAWGLTEMSPVGTLAWRTSSSPGRVDQLDRAGEHRHCAPCRSRGCGDRRRAPKWDERPLLVVIRKPGAQVTREERLAHYEGRIARWQIRDDVVFVNEIAHTATGKIQKLKLREQFRDHVLPGTRRVRARRARAARTVSGRRQVHLGMSLKPCASLGLTLLR